MHVTIKIYIAHPRVDAERVNRLAQWYVLLLGHKADQQYFVQGLARVIYYLSAMACSDCMPNSTQYMLLKQGTNYNLKMKMRMNQQTGVILLD